MGQVYQVVQGVTDPLDVQLLNSTNSSSSTTNAILQPFNATDMTVTMVITTNDGSPAPSVVGKVGWLNQSVSIVRYTPAATDLKWSASPYSVRWIVTDQTGATYAFPRFTTPDQISVGQ